MIEKKVKRPLSGKKEMLSAWTVDEKNNNVPSNPKDYYQTLRTIKNNNYPELTQGMGFKTIYRNSSSME